MHGALAELLGDFRCGKVGDLDAIEPGNSAAIVAGAARLDELQSGAREKAFRILLQPAFRGHGKEERSVHGAPPAAVNSSMAAAKPTAGMASRAPSRVRSAS